jgi:hypothetical protein
MYYLAIFGVEIWPFIVRYLYCMLFNWIGTKSLPTVILVGLFEFLIGICWLSLAKIDRTNKTDKLVFVCTFSGLIIVCKLCFCSFSHCSSQWEGGFVHGAWCTHGDLSYWRKIKVFSPINWNIEHWWHSGWPS